MGKVPDLHMLQSPGQAGGHHPDHMDGAGLPHRELAMHPMAAKDGGQHGGIPQASVRPQVRPLPMGGKQEGGHTNPHHEHQDIKPLSASKPPSSLLAADQASQSPSIPDQPCTCTRQQSTALTAQPT